MEKQVDNCKECPLLLRNGLEYNCTEKNKTIFRVEPKPDNDGLPWGFVVGKIPIPEWCPLPLPITYTKPL